MTELRMGNLTKRDLNNRIKEISFALARLGAESGEEVQAAIEQLEAIQRQAWAVFTKLEKERT